MDTDRSKESRGTRASTSAAPTLLTSQAELCAITASTVDTDEAGTYSKQGSHGDRHSGATANGQTSAVVIGPYIRSGSMSKFGFV